MINACRRNRQLASEKGVNREGDSQSPLLKDIYEIKEGSHPQSRQPVLPSSKRTLNTSQLNELGQGRVQVG